MRDKKVNPFFEGGINHEINYLGKYRSRDRRDSFRNVIVDQGRKYTHKLSANLGVGLSIKLNHKFKIEMKYDLYRSLTRIHDPFTAFSFLAGVKYNL